MSKKQGAVTPSKAAVKKSSNQTAVKFSADVSRGFVTWLKDQKSSLAITTYQVGKLIFIGVDKANKLWVHNRGVGRCLGLASDENGFWVSSDSQLYRFGNMMKDGEQGQGGEDALYAPRQSFFTGDLDIHDVRLGKDGAPIFVNTLFNCLAKPSPTRSFEPIWTPPFISRLVAEDRCHLNGLALVDGMPRYVTAISDSDTFGGWRDHRRDGGLVMDVKSGENICSGLSMPHSPRWHKGKLWVHNSGTGEFGFVDMKGGAFEPVAFCPGYLRGLDFIGDCAVVGLSLPRGNKTFSGLALDERLTERKINPRCGIYFIDLKTGAIKHSITFGGLVTELYDVSVLKNVRQPAAISPLSNDIKRMIVVN